MSDKKRKHVVITIQQKLDILQQLESGVSVKKVASEYNIGRSTIHDIKKNKDKLVKFSLNMSDSVYGIENRCSMKKSPFELLNRALLCWFNEERSQGRPVSGPACIQQAKLLHETLGLEGKFDASTGWLQRFKDRNGIRSVGDTLDCVWTSAACAATWAPEETLPEISKPEGCNENENAKTDSNNENVPGESSIDKLNAEADGGVRKDQDDLIDISGIELICEDKLHEVEEVPRNVEDSPSQASTTREETTALQSHSSEAEKAQQGKEHSDQNESSEMNSVIKRLEGISDKLTAMALGDSYDQFGKYISSLLRGLPPKKVLSLKQKMVTDVLDVLLAHEKGLPDESLITPCQCSCGIQKKKPNRTPQLPNFNQIRLARAHNSNFSSSCTSMPVSDLPSAQESSPTPSSNSRNQLFQHGSINQLDVRDSPTTPESFVGASRNRTARKRAQKRKLSKNVEETWCESSGDEINIDIEEGKELKDINKHQGMFETVFCDPNTSDMFDIQVKEETEDLEEGRDPDPGASGVKVVPSIVPPTSQLLCDLCYEPCASLQELVVHFSLHHPGCVPTFKDQSEEDDPPEAKRRCSPADL